MLGSCKFFSLFHKNAEQKHLHPKIIGSRNYSLDYVRKLLESVQNQLYLLQGTDLSEERMTDAELFLLRPDLFERLWSISLLRKQALQMLPAGKELLATVELGKKPLVSALLFLSKGFHFF